MKILEIVLSNPVTIFLVLLVIALGVVAVVVIARTPGVSIRIGSFFEVKGPPLEKLPQEKESQSQVVAFLSRDQFITIFRLYQKNILKGVMIHFRDLLSETETLQERFRPSVMLSVKSEMLTIVREERDELETAIPHQFLHNFIEKNYRESQIDQLLEEIKPLLFSEYPQDIKLIQIELVIDRVQTEQRVKLRRALKSINGRLTSRNEKQQKSVDSIASDRNVSNA